jgi:ketosteroid isomerase-like protein
MAKIVALTVFLSIAACAYSLPSAVMLFPACFFGGDGTARIPEQQEVWKVSQAWLDAFNHRDLDSFARYVADDFIGSTDDGLSMTKASLLKRLSIHPAAYEQRTNLRDVRVRVEGDTAIVNYLVTLIAGGYQNTTLVFQVRRTEFFQKKKGTWLAIAAHESALPVNLRKPVKADPKTLKDYVGRYEYRPGFANTYTVEGGHLMDEWKGAKSEAFPIRKDTFFESDDLG